MNILAIIFGECFDNFDWSLEFFKNFFHQRGYPVVHVSKNGEKSILFQEQFFLSGGVKSKIWTLPVTYILSNGTRGTVWLPQQKMDSSIPISGIPIFNYRYGGYFRVNYPKEVLDAVIGFKHTLETDQFMRAQIINDVFSFSKSTSSFGYPVPGYETALEIISSHLDKETMYLPLMSGLNALQSLEMSLPEISIGQFLDYVKPIAERLYKRFPLDKTENNPVAVSLTNEIGFWACRLGVESCINHAKSKLKKFYELYESSGQSNLSGVIISDFEVPLCVDIRNGSTKTWYLLLERIKRIETYQPVVSTEWVTLARAMGCTQEAFNMNILMDYFTDDASVAHVVLSIARGNRQNVLKLLTVFLEEKYHSSFLEHILYVLSPYINADNIYAFKQFLDRIQVKEALEDAIANAEIWNKEKLPILKDALQKASGEGKAAPIALAVFFSAILSFISSAFRT